MEIREKVKKASKRLAILMLAVVLLLVITVVFMGYVFANIDAEYVAGRLLWQSEWDLSMARFFTYGVILPLFGLAAAYLAFRIFWDIFRLDKSPFAEENAKRIGLIGKLFIACAFLSWFAGSLAVKMIWGERVSFPFLIHFEFGYLLAGILICGLSTIFRFGSQLQRESDETL